MSYQSLKPYSWFQHSKQYQFDTEFCDRFGYPEQVKEWLEIIGQTCLSHLGRENVISILLLGSVCRGEGTFFLRGAKVSALSDFDLIVTVKRKEPTQAAQLKKEILRLYEMLRPDNVLFNIDIGIVSKRRLKLWNTNLWCYETKKNAVCLYGEDARRFLPRVTLSNLDYGDLQELVMYRLWYLLLYTPKNVVLGCSSTYENSIAKYVHCRNALDILSIVLPFEGYLATGYQERMAIFEKEYRRLRWARYFPEENIPLLRECLQGKTSFSLERMKVLNLRELFKLDYGGYVNLLKYFLNAPPELPTESLLDKFLKEFRFNDSLRGRFRRLYLATKVVTRGKGRLSWIRIQNLRKVSIASMVCLFEAYDAIVHRADPKKATQWLERLQRLLEGVYEAPLDFGVVGDLKYRWLEARKAFVEFMCHWNYGHMPEKWDYFRRCITWEEEPEDNGD